MNRRGFTAMELVVVFLLIAVATVLVMRANVVARNRARDSTCMVNLKEMALALHMYAADNNYRLPPELKAWKPIYPYVGSTAIFLCPYTDTESPAAEIGYRGEYTGLLVSDYLLNPTVQIDDLPATIIAGDDAPDRHSGRRWIGVRLDGAAALFAAAEWETKLGKVSKDAKDEQ